MMGYAVLLFLWKPAEQWFLKLLFYNIYCISVGYCSRLSAA